MQPSFGRFHSLRSASGENLIARLTPKSALEVLDTDVAYCASLRDVARHAKVRGREKPPSVELLALLLAIPSTVAEILRTEGELAWSGEHPGKHSSALQLTCQDRSGVELKITVAIHRIPAKNILKEMHEALFSAVAALEAVVRDASGEKHSHVLTEKDRSKPSLLTVKTASHPLEIHGQAVETRAVFRRAAAADANVRDNRAFVIANAAARARAELLEQRRARKAAERQKKEHEKRLLRNAKRKHEMIKASKGKPALIVKRRKKSLFEIQDDDAPGVPEASNSGAAKLDVTAPSKQNAHDRMSPVTAKQEAIPISRDIGRQRASPLTSAGQAAAANEESDVTGRPEPVPSAAQLPPKRKKKKKVRALV